MATVAGEIGAELPVPALVSTRQVLLRSFDRDDSEEKTEREDDVLGASLFNSVDELRAGCDSLTLARSSVESNVSAEKTRVKEAQLLAVIENAVDDEAAQHSEEESEDGKAKTLKRPASTPSMRSPSRLTASLFGGRDRMARAAKAWRDGARRAGLLGAEDDEEDWQDGDDMQIHAKRNSLSETSSNLAEISEPAKGSQLDEHDLISAEEEEEEHEDAVSERVVVATLGVPRLVPSRLDPMSSVPRMVQLWGFLDRIECISIRDFYVVHDDEDSGGTVHYVLDVYYYQEQHRIPTGRHRASGTLTRRTNSGPSQPPLRTPDYQIQHRFSSFLKLRRRVLDAAHRKHPRVPNQPDETRAPSSSHRHCAYCQRLSKFIALGSESLAPLGWRTKLFTTVEMRKTLLSQFVTELVVLAREGRNACSNLNTLTMLHQPPARYVQRSVPGILKRFLTAQTGENYMR